MVEGNYVAWIKSDRVKELVTGSAKTHCIQQAFEKVIVVKQKKKKKMMEIKCVELTVP